ncbi:serine/threonine-protein kinase [Kitasatospora sp. NPDC058965]|uniref:serine/threonine-protein kinase n=1 Tax=Kitasatospora sp. NPDC058965 TaxID=3346682 RepID=UPI0036C27312
MPAHDPRSDLHVFSPLHPDDPAEVAGYRLHARLGAGGMGRVYLSYTPGGRPVALKVVRPELAEDPEFRRRFAQEVANAQRIHGLYTAQVIDAGTTAEAPWLVTAYVPGPSLAQAVRDHGALPVRTALLLMGGIAEALQVIHRVGVVHRDLKPANVLLAADGPRVIDFGIARAADATALTSTGLRIGSPAFMAPEQAQGHPVTPASDVFALGALIAYVVGGVPPFGEGPETAVLYRVVHEQPELAAVPADLHPLLLRCLAKDPADRPTTAEVIEAARAHPEVGGQLRFTEDWLPAGVTGEIARRTELPAAPRTDPTVLLRAGAAVGTPGSAEAVPVEGPTALRPPRRPGVSWKALVAVAVLMLGAGGGVTALLLRSDPAPAVGADRASTAPPSTAAASTAASAASPTAGAGSAAPPPSAPPMKYTVGYKDRTLAIAPDADQQFDLKNGRVEAGGVLDWHLATYGPEFLMSDGTDAYIAKDGGALTPEQCATGLDQAPVANLKFEDLPPGRSFCLRSKAAGTLVVLKVVKLTRDTGAATATLTSYAIG